jgi:hypothetical protein
VEDKIQKPEEDVEAHKKNKLKAFETDDESGSEDFELHKRRGATDEESGDDVELHRKNKLTK